MYYSVLYLHGADADPYLAGQGPITPAVVAANMQRMVEQSSGLTPVKEWGGLVLRDGDQAVRQGDHVLVWNLREWDLQLLLVES
jgi:hypothetical protein